MSIPTTWGDLLAVACHRFGDRVAVRARGEQRSYAELLDAGARLAQALGGRGLVPGDRVALMLEDRVEGLEAYLGCAFGGFTAVHVNDRLRPAEVQAILADAGVRALVHTDGRSAVVAEVPGLADLAALVTIGSDLAPTALAYDVLLAAALPVMPVPRVAPGDAAVVGYTSGTTGAPKGVVITQAGLVRTVVHMPVHYGLRPYSRCAFTGTFSFVSALWGVMLPHLHLGGELSFLAGLPADEWVARMTAERAEFTYVPSPLASGFLDAVERAPAVLDHLQGVLHSASALPPSTVRRMVDVLGGRFVETWGMTETGAPVTATVPSDWLNGAAHDIWASVGRPVHIASVRVLDDDGGEVPAGTTGELCVATETMFGGYLGRPQETAQVLRDGWLHTGDLGHVDAAGYVYITDRAKDLVVSGGMNVYPAEVEQALQSLPGVAEVAVIGLPDQRWGETVVAVVVRTPGGDVTARDVVAHARSQLAGYKKPTRVAFVEALPRGASMKVQKHLLRKQASALFPCRQH